MDSKIFLENGRIQSKGYAMLSKDAKFTPFEFTRHAVGDNDILIKILYAGICHSDIHTARSEWGEAVYPCVPGHEIAGEVIAVGKNVSKFKVGDYAGVGCMVNSCGECEACKKADALAMGVSSFYTSTDKNAVKERFDLIISTIPTPYDPSAYMDLLKFGGEMAIVGLPPHEVAPSISVITFVHKAGKKVYGSLIGGIAETQEMLDFSLKHKIYPETELITSKDIDKAYENLTSGKAKFRYVIDMRDE
ncbi:hypothetical protein CYB17_07255 [Campylobacter coli]|nr:hypothetical protein [Campylobacter coli]